MNVAQLIRKARLGCDAVLPSGAVSALWLDDEMVDIANEAYDEATERLRLVHKKWGIKTVKQTDLAFSVEGETYDPGPNLTISNKTTTEYQEIISGTSDTPTKVWLPPDFLEMAWVTCMSNRTVRFIPAQAETYHWIDMLQGSFNTSGGGVLPSTPDGLTFYWDIMNNRTMTVIPPVTQTFTLQLDYIPLRRPMYYTTAGSVALINGSATVAGTGTVFQSSNIYSEATSQAAELIPGVTSLQDANLLLSADYYRIKSIASDTSLTLVSPWPGNSNATSTYMIAMTPAIPRVYHRWISRLMSVLMLGKVSPDLRDKYRADWDKQFMEVIQPNIRVRQSQDSVVTEDSEEMGVTSEW